MKNPLDLRAIVEIGFSQRLRVLTVLLFTTLLFTGCQFEDGNSGFLEGDHGAEPIQHEYSLWRPSIQISDPKDVTVIVYTHGTQSSLRKEDCDNLGNQVPPSLLALHGDQVLIYYHCSTATDRFFSQSTAGNWIYERADELSDIVDELHDAGVPAKNIFLAGHSAGGWSALMSTREFGDKFNGVIAFAPAFAGRRSEVIRYPRWRREIRPRQIAYMLQAERIHALVLAYSDDPFNRPEDLEFLTESYPESLKLIGYRCGVGHMTHIRDCKLEQTTEAIKQFIGTD